MSGPSRLAELRASLPPAYWTVWVGTLINRTGGFVVPLLAFYLTQGRIEVEEACTADVFQKLWSLTEGRRVQKRRYAIPDGSLVWEIDEFLDRALWLAEVELPTEDTEAALPGWLAPYVEREVTSDPEYVNANLAC